MTIVKVIGARAFLTRLCSQCALTEDIAPYSEQFSLCLLPSIAGGIYSAYRMLSGFAAPPSVCVFEATNRVGGR